MSHGMYRTTATSRSVFRDNAIIEITHAPSRQLAVGKILRSPAQNCRKRAHVSRAYIENRSRRNPRADFQLFVESSQRQREQRKHDFHYDYRRGKPFSRNETVGNAAPRRVESRSSAPRNVQSDWLAPTSAMCESVPTAASAETAAAIPEIFVNLFVVFPSFMACGECGDYKISMASPYE